MSVKPIVKDGKVFYSVRDTARILEVSREKVKELMGADVLEWGQTQVNGPLIISAKSIELYKAFVKYSNPKTT
jgi:hypothetical protein